LIEKRKLGEKRGEDIFGHKENRVVFKGKGKISEKAPGFDGRPWKGLNRHDLEKKRCPPRKTSGGGPRKAENANPIV